MVPIKEIKRAADVAQVAQVDRMPHETAFREQSVERSDHGRRLGGVLKNARRSDELDRLCQLNVFARRLANSVDAEIAAAIDEIGDITLLRLLAKVDEPGASHGIARAEERSERT